MRSQTRSESTHSAVVPAPQRRVLDVLPRVAVVTDLVIVTASAITAGVVRSWLGLTDLGSNVWEVAPILLVLWIGVIAVLGGYRKGYFGAGVEEYKVVINATLVAAGVTSALSYLSKYELSRSYFLISFGVGLVGLVFGRLVLRRTIQTARRGGALCHDVVIAGTPEHIDEIAAVLSRESWLGYRVLGAIVPAADLAEETRRGIPILGPTTQTRALLATVNADVVFLAGGAMTGAAQMRELVWELEHQDVQVIVAPSVTDVSRERIRVRPVGGLPLVHIDPPRHARSRRRAKRIFDLTVSLGLVFLIAPVLVGVSLWIRLHDHGPILFRQTRTGRDGKEFECLKFRSMVTDAEDRLADLHRDEGYDGVGLFKSKQDPRITGPGRVLRRLSLDELPQLFNVIRGDMSLVGPRPPLPTEVATYNRYALRRLHVRPGITGLWQVSGRSDLSWDEAIRLDLYYVDNWSMLQDLSILSKTLGAVVGSRGAY